MEYYVKLCSPVPVTYSECWSAAGVNGISQA